MIEYETFYTPAQKALHEAHDSDRLARMVLGAITSDEIRADFAPMIAASDFFFLSTVNAEGMPTVSYKGGAPGFVRNPDPKTLIFPIYDGNGMFLSAGNIAETAKVGLLFIDFERPNRLRVQGEATVSADDPMMSAYPGARMIARVRVTACFLNCGRYIHKHARLEPSRHVPAADGAQPFPVWKRIDAVQDSLRREDMGRAAAEGGLITFEDYVAAVGRGEA